VDKRGVQDRFRRKLVAAHADRFTGGGDWSDLDLVLDLILDT
jgi:hypothetical protein